MKPFSHPTLADVQPHAVLHALSDPTRAAIFARIMSVGCVQACSAVAALGDRVIPKSSLSNHLRVLRDAGLIRSERHGTEVRNHSRWDEMEARYPGLLPAILRAYVGTGSIAGTEGPG